MTVSSSWFAALTDTRALTERTVSVALALLLLVVAWAAAKLVTAAVRRGLARVSTAGHVDILLGRASGVAVFALGTVLALSVAGVRVGAILASLGLIGAALGLALREILANTFAGVVLLLQRPFRIGDTIAVAGVEGAVQDVRIHDTIIETADGRVCFVPNMTVFSSTITNLSLNPTRRVEVRVNVPADADLALASDRVLEAVSNVAGVLSHPAAEVQAAALGTSSARITAFAWVDTTAGPMGPVQREAALAASAAVRGLSAGDAVGETRQPPPEASTGPAREG